jgi:hypothetical protein
MLMSLQLFHLFLSEILFVSRITLKRKGIIRILRMTLMINILSVLPIRELSHIAAHLLSRSIVLR